MTHDEIMSLINRSLFAEIGYTDEKGRQNIRKTFCVWHKGLGGHLISTNTSSSHIKTLLKNENVCIYFSDDNAFEGVCLYGKAVVHIDREYKELLWNEGEAGRYYRYDGKGDLTLEEIRAFDAGKEYENGYAKVNANG